MPRGMVERPFQGPATSPSKRSIPDAAQSRAVPLSPALAVRRAARLSRPRAWAASTSREVEQIPARIHRSGKAKARPSTKPVAPAAHKVEEVPAKIPRRDPASDVRIRLAKIRAAGARPTSRRQSVEVPARSIETVARPPVQLPALSGREDRAEVPAKSALEKLAARLAKVQLSECEAPKVADPGLFLDRHVARIPQYEGDDILCPRKSVRGSHQGGITTNERGRSSASSVQAVEVKNDPVVARPWELRYSTVVRRTEGSDPFAMIAACKSRIARFRQLLDEAVSVKKVDVTSETTTSSKAKQQVTEDYAVGELILGTAIDHETAAAEADPRVELSAETRQLSRVISATVSSIEEYDPLACPEVLPGDSADWNPLWFCPDKRLQPAHRRTKLPKYDELISRPKRTGRSFELAADAPKTVVEQPKTVVKAKAPKTVRFRSWASAEPHYHDVHNVSPETTAGSDSVSEGDLQDWIDASIARTPAVDASRRAVLARVDAELKAEARAETDAASSTRVGSANGSAIGSRDRFGTQVKAQDEPTPPSSVESPEGSLSEAKHRSYGSGAQSSGAGNGITAWLDSLEPFDNLPDVWQEVANEFCDIWLDSAVIGQ